MMKSWICIVILCLFYSCEGQNEDVVERVDINAIIADPANEFIYFEDGNTQYFYPQPLILDELSNRYLENGDQLNINMTDIADQFHCNVHITDAGIANAQFPYTVKQDSEGVLFFELKEPKRPVDIVFGPNDDVNYFGSNLTGMELTITSLENNIISCSFKGSIKTKVGSQINLNSGMLRVRLRP